MIRTSLFIPFRSIQAVVILAVLMLVSSCNRGGGVLSSRPSGVLSEDEMVDILVDINLAESALRVGNGQHNMPADSVYQKSQFLAVYEKNGTTPDAFRKSLEYYTQHIELLDKIYSDAIDRLQEMEIKMQENGKKAASQKKPE